MPLKVINWSILKKVPKASHPCAGNIRKIKDAYIQDKKVAAIASGMGYEGVAIWGPWSYFGCLGRVEKYGLGVGAMYVLLSA